MSSNHLSIEPAPPENAHNHHSCLIEGCPSSCPLTLAEEVKGWKERVNNMHIVKHIGGEWIFTWGDDEEDEYSFLTEFIQSLRTESYEDGIRELYNLYGEPRCEYLHHPRSTQHRASEECPVEKRIKLLLNQKQS